MKKHIDTNSDNMDTIEMNVKHNNNEKLENEGESDTEPLFHPNLATPTNVGHNKDYNAINKINEPIHDMNNQKLSN